jgi:hypothetical protein
MGLSRQAGPGLGGRVRKRLKGRHGGVVQRQQLPKRAKKPRFRWAEAISEPEWLTYSKAIDVLRDSGIPAMLGGGFALATFTGRWRDTKDIDFYIRPEDRDAAVAALSGAGFTDYFSLRPYDRKWIYRSTKSGVIVDIIWAMANQRAQVDDSWFMRAESGQVRDEEVKVLPLEEFMWCKLYILQRDHCDWPDLLNLLYASGPRLDWDYLIERLEEDLPLLKGLLSVYSWLCPRNARELPARLWRRLGLPPALGVPTRLKRDHIRLLDGRYWFAALGPSGKKLEV